MDISVGRVADTAYIAIEQRFGVCFLGGYARQLILGLLLSAHLAMGVSNPERHITST
jgi:hypothetical protein